MESLELIEHVPKSIEWIYQHIKHAHYLNLWLGKTSIIPQGFKIIIIFPLNQIELIWNVLQHRENHKLEFLSSSPYLSKPALLTFLVKGLETTSTVTIIEKAEYGESRWKNAKEIHYDIWRQALTRLKNLATSEI